MIIYTAVELDGPRATNSVSRTLADAGPDLIELAHQVTCGDRTLADDGVSSQP
ncbi:hypothetical protein SAMN05661080_02192 [Modestobacter sp. DSM 44400]|uniref:hypothetical protein n=1 Tax=Modestobacter sp. DSM 44400 TaxID=1550230 RepID=UPI00089613E3|nr:hypothetical protein [Modestobacter sp. DSM 44400]SDY05960.1 hypothetical protein SAMN05661080_02192 [Modestobacter sp. DSM 44400]